MKTNKTVSKIIFGMSAAFALALAVAVAGCATNKPDRQALVCPGCKSVEVPMDASIAQEGPGWIVPSTTTKHTCPGCQGYLRSFFKEGKLTHECSVCAQSPFTCPISHKW